jgi:CDP-diacylglycerol--serine O-phosphatidyltransferase
MLNSFGNMEVSGTMDMRQTAREAWDRVKSAWLYIPNLITVAGLCAGLTAIPLAFEEHYGWAIAAILLAAALDGLDGAAARMLNAHSKFGAELDSLADFVSFGVAPGVMLYLWGMRTMPILGWAAVLVYAAAAALRLARFNVNNGAGGAMWKRRFFTGVPTPAGAIMVLLPLYIEGLGLRHAYIPGAFVALYMVLIAALMVSRYPAFSPKSGDPDTARRQMVVLIIAGVIGMAALAEYPYLTLFLCTLAYGASIPFAVYLYRKNMDLDKTAAISASGEPPLTGTVH